MKNKNHITINYNVMCKECNNTPLIYDKLHHELYCFKCGLIHEKDIIPNKLIKCFRMPVLETTFYIMYF